MAVLSATGSQSSAACKPKIHNFPSPVTNVSLLLDPCCCCCFCCCCHCLLWKGKKLLIVVCCCITVVGCCSSIRRLSTFLPPSLASLPANIASGPLLTSSWPLSWGASCFYYSPSTLQQPLFSLKTRMTLNAQEKLCHTSSGEHTNHHSDIHVPGFSLAPKMSCIEHAIAAEK